jgi:hypothetical protein
MLKDRLGTPTPPSHNQQTGQPVYHRTADGYIQSQNKIDPVHGPDARSRLQGDDLYKDADNPQRRHKCGNFSTGFGPDQGEAYVYAEHHARSKIDPHSTQDPQVVRVPPEEAWGPGDHSDRFRGYYIDPQNPVDQAGNVNYKPVDFQGAEILAVYRRDGNGGYKLVTMYPEPDPARNQ